MNHTNVHNLKETNRKRALTKQSVYGDRLSVCDVGDNSFSHLESPHVFLGQGARTAARKLASADDKGAA